MDAIFNNETFWQAVGYVLGVALSVGVVAFMAQYAAKWSKQAAYYAVRWTPTLIAALDEPKDPWIVRLDEFAPGLGGIVMRAGPSLLRAFADELEKAATPAPEVAIYKSTLTAEELALTTPEAPAPLTPAQETLPEGAKTEAVP